MLEQRPGDLVERGAVLGQYSLGPLFLFAQDPLDLLVDDARGAITEEKRRSELIKVLEKLEK